MLESSLEFDFADTEKKGSSSESERIHPRVDPVREVTVGHVEFVLQRLAVRVRG